MTLATWDDIPETAAAPTPEERRARQIIEQLPVMLCRCGRGMRLPDMARPPGPRPAGFGRAARIDPIICTSCAAAS